MNSYPLSTNQSRFSRLHPLVAVAAGSVVLVSLLGAAAITGILPNSNAKAASDGVAISAPADVSTPAAKTSVQKAASQKPATQKSSTQVAANSNAPAQPAAAPAAPAQKNSVVGIGVGALVGGALGSQIGSGDGKTLATIAGAVGGGYVGNEIAKKNAAP
ncbi:glycine zipper 2TM domain-containing protein [Rhodoferax sp. TS-BS-61-7]|uniref:glycine zipper 2TM domain-containing protein n=1 Tax=Rhodoferax sp. TS-BS-61-7 TaxID=2094194 RepID=UPI000CF71A19|nr:glycine zipper 2TM domain-containing protein [Rhodoferax sp. TS-BS-61-7]PQA78143.1 hypothetical protein C5F53_07380 [Rhodoferax sp. TS-BS-61-7]